ncbi:unnamed protein product [Closterium sp. NIES-65]|nr:unnamed protein product [Closterium sp. NIES-65]
MMGRWNGYGVESEPHGMAHDDGSTREIILATEGGRLYEAAFEEADKRDRPLKLLFELPDAEKCPFRGIQMEVLGLHGGGSSGGGFSAGGGGAGGGTTAPGASSQRFFVLAATATRLLAFVGSTSLEATFAPFSSQMPKFIELPASSPLIPSSLHFFGRQQRYAERFAWMAGPGVLFGHLNLNATSSSASPCCPSPSCSQHCLSVCAPQGHPHLPVSCPLPALSHPRPFPPPSSSSSEPPIQRKSLLPFAKLLPAGPISSADDTDDSAGAAAGAAAVEHPTAMAVSEFHLLLLYSDHIKVAGAGVGAEELEGGWVREKVHLPCPPPPFPHVSVLMKKGSSRQDHEPSERGACLALPLLRRLKRHLPAPPPFLILLSRLKSHLACLSPLPNIMNQASEALVDQLPFHANTHFPLPVLPPGPHPLIHLPCSTNLLPACQQIVNQVSEVLVDQLPFHATALEMAPGGMLGLVADEVASAYYAFCSNNIYEIAVCDEGRAMWQVYLDRHDYAMALSFCRTPLQRDRVYAAQAEMKVYLDRHDYTMALSSCRTPLQRDRVYAAQAESAFKDGDYERAATFFARTAHQVPFEEVALKFVEAGQQDALRSFLLHKLDHLPKQERAQMTMVATWASELYLDKVTHLPDTKAYLDKINRLLLQLPPDFEKHDSIATKSESSSAAAAAAGASGAAGAAGAAGASGAAGAAGEGSRTGAEGSRTGGSKEGSGVEGLREEYRRVVAAFRAFLSDCKDVLNEATTVKLLASYGREEELVYFAGLKQRHETVIEHFIRVSPSVTSVLSARPPLLPLAHGPTPLPPCQYKFSPALVLLAPSSTVDLWIMSASAASRVLPLLSPLPLLALSFPPPPSQYKFSPALVLLAPSSTVDLWIMSVNFLFRILCPPPTTRTSHL